MESVRNFYAHRCVQHTSCGWQSAGWFSSEDQRKRFEIVAAKLGTVSSLLDVGCGHGEFLDHIAPRDYLGIDITPAMIDHARQKYPRHEFRQGDILDFQGKKFEASVAIGTFGLHLGDNYDYVDRAFAAMSAVSSRWVVVMPKKSELPYEFLFYYDHDVVSAILSRRAATFRIDTATLPYEMIICAESGTGDADSECPRTRD